MVFISNIYINISGCYFCCSAACVDDVKIVYNFGVNYKLDNLFGNVFQTDF